MKRQNPYTNLLSEIKSWSYKAVYRKKIEMFYFPKGKLSDSWSVVDLYERTKAAEQLGYDVQLFATDKGLEVKYVAKVPEIPWRWRY